LRNAYDGTPDWLNPHFPPGSKGRPELPSRSGAPAEADNHTTPRLPGKAVDGASRLNVFREALPPLHSVITSSQEPASPALRYHRGAIMEARHG